MLGGAVYVVGGYSNHRKDFVADAWMLDLAALDRSPARQARRSWVACFTVRLPWMLSKPVVGAGNFIARSA